VFTARYALSPYIKQIHFVFKGLRLNVSNIYLPVALHLSLTRQRCTFTESLKKVAECREIRRSGWSCRIIRTWNDTFQKQWFRLQHQLTGVLSAMWQRIAEIRSHIRRFLRQIPIPPALLGILVRLWSACSGILPEMPQTGTLHQIEG
jgi:hypothetical protein